MSKAGLRCVQFGLAQRNATRNPAHLQMRTFGCLKPNLPSPRQKFLPLLPVPRQQSQLPCRIPPHLDTNLHTAQPLVEHPQSTLNALVTAIPREPRVALVHGNPSQPLSVEYPSSSTRTSSHGLFTPRLFTCPTRCSIHHHHWVDRRIASTLRHFPQPN